MSTGIATPANSDSLAERNRRSEVGDRKSLQRSIRVAVRGDFVESARWMLPSQLRCGLLTPGRFVSPNGSGVVVRSNGLNTIGLDPRGIEIDLT